MKNDNNRNFEKKEFLRNGTKTQNQWPKNHINQSIEKPALNESAIDAQKKGF
ncbi:MAG: hypothetical protein ABRQ25_16045 [Clostridiaceae bacterium]